MTQRGLENESLRKKIGGTLSLDLLTDLIFKTLDRIGSFKKRVEKSLKDQKIKLQRWMIATVVLAIAISICLAFFSLGLLFLAMDNLGFSRGEVFTSGGLLGLLVLGWIVLKQE